MGYTITKDDCQNAYQILNWLPRKPALPSQCFEKNLDGSLTRSKKHLPADSTITIITIITSPTERERNCQHYQYTSISRITNVPVKSRGGGSADGPPAQLVTQGDARAIPATKRSRQKTCSSLVAPYRRKHRFEATAAWAAYLKTFDSPHSSPRVDHGTTRSAEQLPILVSLFPRLSLPRVRKKKKLGSLDPSRKQAPNMTPRYRPTRSSHLRDSKCKEYIKKIAIDTNPIPTGQT